MRSKFFVGISILAIDISVVSLVIRLIIHNVETYDPITISLFALLLLVLLPVFFVLLPYLYYQNKHQTGEQPLLATPQGNGFYEGRLSHKHGLPRGVTIKFTHATRIPLITYNDGVKVEFGNAEIEIDKLNRISVHVHDELFKATVLAPGLNMIHMG